MAEEGIDGFMGGFGAGLYSLILVKLETAEWYEEKYKDSPRFKLGKRAGQIYMVACYSGISLAFVSIGALIYQSVSD